MRIGGMGKPPWAKAEEELLTESALIYGDSPSAQTAQLILSGISSKELRPGERLPSERVLSQELNVGRSAVREALSALEMLGVVEVIPGSGAYVRASTSEVLPKTLSWGLLLNQDSLMELMGVREALETYAVQAAAHNADTAGIEVLATAVQRQQEAISAGDNEGYVRADQDFHIEISSLCGNVVLAQMGSTVRGLLRVWLERQVQSAEDMQEALAEHRMILDAISAKDSEAAAGAMRAHMRTAARRLTRINNANEDHSDAD